MKELVEYEKEIRGLLDEMDDKPSSRKHVIDRFRQLIIYFEERLDLSKSNSDYEEERIKKLEELLKAEKISKKNKAEYESQLGVAREHINYYKDEQLKLCVLKSLLEDSISKKGYFDKYKCFQNIRKLMREKNIKLGQIESEAGVRIGYMSRLEKPDNDAEPGIMFLVTAAKLLGVTIDELIYSQPEELSKDEKYVDEFLHDLIKDTDEHNIHWEKERDDILRRSYDTFEDIVPEHPLLTFDVHASTPDSASSIKRYISQFYPESKVKVRNCYSASLLGEGKIFIVNCCSEIEDEYIPDKKFFEVYVTDSANTVNPVCNTLKSAEGLRIIINRLYQMAENDAASVHINKATRKIIDNYRTASNLPF